MNFDSNNFNVKVEGKGNLNFNSGNLNASTNYGNNTFTSQATSNNLNGVNALAQHQPLTGTVFDAVQVQATANTTTSGNLNATNTNNPAVTTTVTATTTTPATTTKKKRTRKRKNKNNAQGDAQPAPPKEKKQRKKKPPKEKKARPKPGQIRETTALDGSKLYLCPECQMASPHRHMLEQHVVSHAIERRFVCDVCFAALKRKDHLTRHKLSHVPDRPHVCNVSLVCVHLNCLEFHNISFTDLLKILQKKGTTDITLHHPQR